MSHKEKYYKYLKSKDWKDKREALFKVRGRVCERCLKNLKNQKADVHHKHYRNIFNEKLSDLEVLCRVCHIKEHSEEKISTFIEQNLDYYLEFYNKYKNYYRYKGFRNKKESKQVQRNTYYNKNIVKQTEYIESKGKIIRSLNKLGIKEHEGKKLIYFSLEELIDIST